MHNKRPRILLIGAGRFGKHHLRVLQELHSKKTIELVGIVTRKNVKELTPAKLESIDAVDVVTPYQTHYDLVKKCLPYTNVFVEKPLAEKSDQAQDLEKLAKRYKRVLMVGHIYRYHSKIKELARTIALNGKLRRVEGVFTSPKESYRKDSAPLEMLHWFDVLDFLIRKDPKAIWADGNTQLCKVSLRYQNKIDADLTLGWQGYRKERLLKLFFDKSTIDINLEARPAKEPLREELLAFIKLIKGGKIDYPDEKVGKRIVSIANKVEDILKKPKKRIAVIGGGLFGATAAIMLSKVGDVTLFERHEDIFQEATYANQYRHHMGYHYPRSIETIREIQEATTDFEAFYKKSIMHDFPAYYAISKRGSRVSAKEFINTCKSMGMPYKKVSLSKEIINQNEIETVVETPEGVVNFDYLKKNVRNKLLNKKINLRFGTEVTDLSLKQDGQKVITAGKKRESFDYVINATYVNHNTFCHQLGFTEKDLEWRLKEIIVAKFPLKKKIGVMVVDGPFATFLPIGNSGLYTFGDAPLSIHEIRTGKNAVKHLENVKKTTATRWPQMQKRCKRWFPFLKDAVYVNSMFSILPLEKGGELTDARPTELTSHGFGCYSILSGKLITAVKTAKEIRNKIMQKNG